MKQRMMEAGVYQWIPHRAIRRVLSVSKAFVGWGSTEEVSYARAMPDFMLGCG